MYASICERAEATKIISFSQMWISLCKQLRSSIYKCGRFFTHFAKASAAATFLISEINFIYSSDVRLRLKREISKSNILLIYNHVFVLHMLEMFRWKYAYTKEGYFANTKNNKNSLYLFYVWCEREYYRRALIYSVIMWRCSAPQHHHKQDRGRGTPILFVSILKLELRSYSLQSSNESSPNKCNARERATDGRNESEHNTLFARTITVGMLDRPRNNT